MTVEVGGGEKRAPLAVALALLLLASLWLLRGGGGAGEAVVGERGAVIYSNYRWFYRFGSDEEWRPARALRQGGLYVNVVPPFPPGVWAAQVRPEVRMCCPLQNEGLLEVKEGMVVKIILEQRGGCYVVGSWEP